MAVDVLGKGGQSVLECHMASLLERLTRELADDVAPPLVIEAPAAGTSAVERPADAQEPDGSDLDGQELTASSADGGADGTSVSEGRTSGETTSADPASDEVASAGRVSGELRNGDGAGSEPIARAARGDGAGSEPSARGARDDDRAGADPACRAGTDVGSAVATYTRSDRVGGHFGDAARTPVERPAAGADPVDTLAAILDGVTSLGETPWHELNGHRVHESLDILEQLDRRLGGLRSAVLSTIEANGLWALEGQRTFKSWLRTRTDTTPGAASQQVRQARCLRDYLPLARAALDGGSISREHVNVLTREAIRTERLRAQLSDGELGEEFLVGQAKEMDAATFAKLVKHWAITVDPEAADRAWREAGTKEQFTLSRTLDGYHLAGWLDEISGTAVDTALRSHMGRKAKDDQRTPAQRRAAALTSLARQSLDSGQQGAHSRIRPHVTVTTSLQMLRKLAAATGSMVPPQRSDGTPHAPGAAFGFPADSSFTSVGGPRDPGGQEDLFDLSPQARQWLDQWTPGQDHVISSAIDPKAMTGVEPATLEDGTPIPPALLSRLACDSGLSRVVFGPQSTILDVGREQRIFPAHMVKAIIARDKHCQAPDCDEPPGFGEIHHSLQWYRDHGPTSVEHGVFVCWHHHDWIHANGITIVRSKGQWYFYDRHGWLITARHDDPHHDHPPSQL